MPELHRSPFHAFHLRAGGKMVEYAGWELPLLYNLPGGGGGIIAEHEHTRRAASIFDVSHMGRLRFTGRDAEAFLQKICTRNLAKATAGQCVYSLICNAEGGILDDVIVTRFDKYWLMVCNAANRLKLLAWFNTQSQQLGLSPTLEDETLKTAMVAVQGPKAAGLLDEVLPDPVSEIKRYHAETMRMMMVVQFTVFRTGYTGEDGAELICGLNAANMAGNYLLKSGKDHPILRPAGLGARDTLRMEAAMPLYGHELHEAVDPLSAGLGWAVDLTKDFIGVEALRRINQTGPTQRLAGLFVEGPRAARQGMTVLNEGQAVGTVTSGVFSPTLKRCIALAYIDVATLAAAPATLTVDCRGTQIPAALTPLPFYKRPK